MFFNAFWILPAKAAYPGKPFRIVVPQAARSTIDTAVRILASELAIQLGQSIVINNKAGGGFTIGLDLVAKAPPDGYTLGLGPVGAMVISPNMTAKLPYDILRDFQPTSLVTQGHLLLAVSPNLAVNNIVKLMAYAKKIRVN